MTVNRPLLKIMKNSQLFVIYYFIYQDLKNYFYKYIMNMNNQKAKHY